MYDFFFGQFFSFLLLFAPPPFKPKKKNPSDEASLGSMALNKHGVIIYSWGEGLGWGELAGRRVEKVADWLGYLFGFEVIFT